MKYLVNIKFFYYVCFVVFFIITVNATEEGWRWRDSLDFDFFYNEMKYSTNPRPGQTDHRKIKVIYDDEEYDKLQDVHIVLARKTNTITSCFKETKKPSNVVIAAYGQLLFNNATQEILLEMCPLVTSNYFFPSGPSSGSYEVDGIIYAADMYNLKKIEDRTDFFEFLRRYSQKASEIILLIDEKSADFLLASTNFRTYKEKLKSYEIDLDRIPTSDLYKETKDKPKHFNVKIPDPFNNFDENIWNEGVEYVHKILEKT